MSSRIQFSLGLFLRTPVRPINIFLSHSVISLSSSSHSVSPIIIFPQPLFFRSYSSHPGRFHHLPSPSNLLSVFFLAPMSVPSSSSFLIQSWLSLCSFCPMSFPSSSSRLIQSFLGLLLRTHLSTIILFAGRGFESLQDRRENVLLQGQLSLQTFISVSVPPRVTAVAHKRSRSFCQKCRWQVTVKHAYTLRMWLCMK